MGKHDDARKSCVANQHVKHAGWTFGKYHAVFLSVGTWNQLTAYLHIQYDDSFPQLPNARNNYDSVLKAGSPQLPNKWQILIGTN